MDASKAFTEKINYCRYYLRMCLDGVAAHYLSKGQAKHFAAVFNAHMSFYILFQCKNKGKQRCLRFPLFIQTVI